VEAPLASVSEEHRTAAYWIDRHAAEYGPVDEPLLGVDALKRHEAALRLSDDGDPLGQADLLGAVDEDAVSRQAGERLTYMREQLSQDALVDGDGEPLADEVIATFDGAPTFEPAWTVAESLVALRCGPYDGSLHRPPVDVDFDRNLCSTVRPGELVQILGKWPRGMKLARTPYALGWVNGRGLSAPVDREAAERALDREVKPLTRRALLEEAFSMLGAPYAWGGKGGGYDCSRFLLEVFSSFGIGLPRHSARQARAGTFSVDVSSVEDPDEKLLLFEAGARRGLVLLQFPGHIMLYLGTTETGVPMALHAFSEFLTPCDGTELETVNRLDRVEVSDLSLGEGSTRTDFLSRVTTMTVFGRSPGVALTADATMRPSAPIAMPSGKCTDSRRVALFSSPLRPDATRPLRVIATSERDPVAATLVLFAPDGSRVEPEQHVLDGPPFSRWVELEEPSAGRWTAVFGDGEQVLACTRFAVARSPAEPEARTTPGPAWPVDRSWNRATENLFSAFVEQLFREPIGDDVTWENLQVVVGDPKRNLLYDFRAVGEDAALRLKPDCADLPYFLRAYFAWKLRLPFVYRMCSRGRKDTPPTCEATLFSNLDSVPDTSDAAAFRRFARRLANTVHSSSPRTVPGDDATDFYPVRLSRQALRPGTVYADPYGHVLVVARWQPQGVSEYGVLVGADAQPDGTVGRRRFWRGSFLFTPETTAVGSGFKGWRPVRFEPAETQPAEPDPSEVTGGEKVIPEGELASPLRVVTNEELREARGIRAWSDMQYRGSADDFYVAMEGLINPRPLEPVRMQVSLVDALEESVARRIDSVDNGEAFMNEHEYATVEMPVGAALFLTTGPWEDYSTPSRDMRLLISIDAVVSFPDTVATHPARFGIRDEDRDASVAAVRATLEEELAERAFEYTRSDGSKWRLTLADVVARTESLEVAYNPNDCVEVRWGAPEDSEEHTTCTRRAPPPQQSRMQKYRPWFTTRTRPH
jgi:hypothetical protein